MISTRPAPLDFDVGEFFRGALDFNAMRDVQETSETSVCFVWDRLVAMPFPQTVMDGKGSGTNGRAVAKYFKETFGSKVNFFSLRV